VLITFETVHVEMAVISAEGLLHVVALKCTSCVGNVRRVNLAAVYCFVCFFPIIIKKQEILANILQGHVMLTIFPVTKFR
jgi:hypothetical protein